LLNGGQHFHQIQWAALCGPARASVAAANEHHMCAGFAGSHIAQGGCIIGVHHGQIGLAWLSHQKITGWAAGSQTKKRLKSRSFKRGKTYQNNFMGSAHL
jgi:hypothetical protein